jgi:hypothetical protein
MKKALALLALLALTLTLAGGAPAENSENKPIICGIENGSYVIRIPVDENDQGWRADDGAADGVVRLAGAEVENGAFVIQYDPMADGETTVSARHYYCAVACDEAHTWDLKVENGAVTECIGGSYTRYMPDEDDRKLDAHLSGEWLEKDTQFNTLTITRNETAGFDFEMVSPISHDACLLKGTVLYDCELDCFVTTDAQMFNLPVEDGAEPELAAPVVGCRIMPIENEEGGIELALAWYAEELGDDQEIVFVK